MGWDAYSSVDRGFPSMEITSSFEGDAFNKIAQQITEKCETVDGGICRGALYCRDSGDMLSKATGESVYVYFKWNVDKVKSLAKSANWNFEYTEEDASAYWSAKLFLETCADLGLSVRFSW